MKVNGMAQWLTEIIAQSHLDRKVNLIGKEKIAR